MLASLAPNFFTFSASCSSALGPPLVLSMLSCDQRRATVSAVQGSGLMPVSLNSTGKLSAWLAI